MRNAPHSRPLLPALALIVGVPLGAALLTGGSARAQGLPSASGAVPPISQTAASADATALLTNPAGLAWVQGVELSLGALTRVTPAAGLNASTFDALAAVSPFDGLALGLGTGLVMPTVNAPEWWTSAALAVAADRALSAGLKLTSVSALIGGGAADLLVDAGVQLRPARMLAFGLAVENIGDGDRGPAVTRMGVSVRPLHELLTVGVDARFIPGDKTPFNAAYLSAAQVVPALAVRLDLGGLAFGIGATVENVGFSVPEPLSFTVLGSVEVNGGHIGANLLGGASGILSNTPTVVAGLRARGSSAAWESIMPDSGRFLTFTLADDGALYEEEGGLLESLFAERPSPTAVLAALANAAEDPAVDGVLVRVRGFSFSFARAAELRAALSRLKEAGKKVVLHMDGGGDLEVYVASVADKVYLTPAGSLDLNGLRAQSLYFADTLAKIGVRADDVHAGSYKSAPRTFTATEPSEQELEVEAALLDSAYATLVDGIAQGRGLSADEVKAAIDLGGLTANLALERKIVDGLAYTDELEAKLEELMGKKVRVDEHYLDNDERDLRWDAPPAIAVVPIVGTITMGGGGGFGGMFGDGAAANHIVDALDTASESEDIKAIVLRIDSPGGDALASDLIWRAIMKAREKKPVIASMGDLAASGGYYVASAAHVILAEPDTLTGSIGVFGLLFEAEELADKIGVRVYEMDRGAVPGPSTFRPMSDAERAALQTQVDATYERFLDAIIEGRGTAAQLSRESLRENAEGRVWTGKQALDRKLVDQIGGIIDALELAREKAGIDKDEPVSLTLVTGKDEMLPQLAGLASVLSKDEREGVRRAAQLLLGDPATAAFLLDHAERPIALTPYALRMR
jgi:protease IV